MFLDLFYGLRKEGIPVSIQEWRMLMTALERGLHGSNLLSFYHLSRATLVKSETYFDAFDRVFAKVFHGVEGELNLNDELEQWLNDPKQFDGLTDEQREAAGAGPDVIRLSVGLESADDLIDDLECALAA